MNLRSAAISAWYGVSTSVSAFLRRLPSLKVLRVRIQDHDEDIDASSLNRSFLDTSWNGSYEILIAVMNSATPSLIELDLSVAGISRTALGWLDLPDSAQNFRQFSSLKVLRITHSCLCDQTVPNFLSSPRDMLPTALELLQIDHPTLRVYEWLYQLEDCRHELPNLKCILLRYREWLSNTELESAIAFGRLAVWEALENAGIILEIPQQGRGK